ncbi:MAG: TIGR04255 family protein [Methanobrevibacter sp.]|jgi:uncharacterized protein (TIGR04255 family)|nr:TIGR04255 family protein [Methanobrevibacter sp.]
MDKKIYKHNSLNQIIFNLKFPYDLLDESKIKSFHENIKNDLKHVFVKNKQEVNLKLNNGKGEFKLENIPLSYVFHDKKTFEESTKYVEIGKNYVVLDYKTKDNNYSNFEDIKSYIRTICVSLKAYELKETNYIGLRYINQIICKKGKPFEWEGIIDSSLLNSNIYDKYEKISNFMHTLSFKKDDFNIIFHFGQFNSDYPNPIARKEFVLDYDCSIDESKSLIDVVSITEQMNNMIYNLFEDSIGEKLRRNMEE